MEGIGYDVERGEREEGNAIRGRLGRGWEFLNRTGIILEKKIKKSEAEKQGRKDKVEEKERKCRKAVPII
jgi:hypothetical protein